MSKSTSKNRFKQRSTWIAAMVACFVFLLMAVKVYHVPAATMINNFAIAVLGLVLIIAITAVVGWLLLFLRKRKK